MSLGVRPLGFYIISFTIFAFLQFGVLSTVYEKRQEEFPMRNYPMHPFKFNIVLVKAYGICLSGPPCDLACQ
jgi:hypothetical protein